MFFFFSSRRRHTRCALVTGVQTCALPISALGTIYHSLLTIEALRARGAPIHGIAFLGDAVPDSEAIIPEISDIRRLGRLPIIDPLNSKTLAEDRKSVV